MRRALLMGTIVVALCGCDEGEESMPTTTAQPIAPSAESRALEPVELTAPRCPPELTNCERASGTILFVERVDPDGDGDAHFVLLSEGITAPGVTVVDVRPDLRPKPLPGRGDQLAAAGPVYEGSFGQRQIQAIEVAVGDAG